MTRGKSGWYYGLTEKQVRRGRQIDKVYEFYEIASSAYGRGCFVRATNTLCRLRDYINSIDLPRKKGGAA
jgi:hypothetical protein